MRTATSTCCTIVARIAVAEGKQATFWNPSATYSRTKRFTGGLGSFMAVLFKPTESIALPDPLYEADQIVPEGSFSHDDFFEVIYRTHEPLRAGKLPPIVLYGNSFAADYLRSGMFFQFSEVHSVKNNEVPIQAALARLPASTRYMVVQLFESYLNDALNYEIPK